MPKIRFSFNWILRADLIGLVFISTPIWFWVLDLDSKYTQKLLKHSNYLSSSHTFLFKVRWIDGLFCFHRWPPPNWKLLLLSFFIRALYEQALYMHCKKICYKNMNWYFDKWIILVFWYWILISFMLWIPIKE